MTDKALITALKGKRPSSVPIWLMRQAGRYLPEYREIRKKAGTFLDLVYNPELATEVTLQPLRRYPLSAAILFSDILVIPHALGQDVGFQAGEGPVLDAIKTRDRMKKLSKNRLDEILSPIYDTVRQVRAGLPSAKALIGFAGAPWTVATYMVEGKGSKDHGEAKKWAYGDPDGFKQLMDLLVDATSGYLIRQIEAGADALQIFDSWAGTLPEEEFRKWCIAPAKDIVNRVKAVYPDIPIIGFPRGAGLLYQNYAAETGFDALSLDTALPARWAADHLQDRWALQGNLDPKFVAVGGQTMLQEADRILRIFSKGPHIFNLGHGLTPDIPPDHVADLTTFVSEWKANDSG